MTKKQGMNALKGWSIGAGALITIGTVTFLSSSRSAEERAMEDIYTDKVIKHNGVDSIEYPSLFDASVLEGMDLETLKQVIIQNKVVNGYEYDKLKRD